MRIAFIGADLEITKKAFKNFVAENSKDINLAIDNRAIFKDNTIVFVASLSNLKLLDGEDIDEIIWVSPLFLPEQSEAIKYVRNRLSNNIPEEFTEWFYNFII